MDEIEEALDHSVREEAKRPESPRLAWQREYLDYLLARRNDAESLRLIAGVELELKSLWSRPDWLRLAKLRLEVRAGRMAEAMSGLKHFALVEASPRVTKIASPNPTRLTDAVAMLRGEKHEAEARDLLRAAYERSLAMEQLQTASFVGLARTAFETGDAARGLKLLQLMLALGRNESRETAGAELAAFDWAKARAVKAASQDVEMLAAIESLAQFQRGRVNDAIETSKRSLGTQARLLTALLQKNASRQAESLATLRDSMMPLGEASIAQPFSTTEDEPRWLLVRLYASQAQPRAALKVLARMSG